MYKLYSSFWLKCVKTNKNVQKRFYQTGEKGVYGYKPKKKSNYKGKVGIFYLRLLVKKEVKHVHTLFTLPLDFEKKWRGGGFELETLFKIGMAYVK